MKKIMLVLCAGLAAVPLLAQNAGIEYTGPSGQGDLIAKGRQGTELMRWGTNSITFGVGPTTKSFTTGTLTVQTNASVGGILTVAGEIDSAGDITLDPGGGDVIVDGDLDSDSVTVNAGEGLDVKTAGSLQLGTATATSVDIGVAATMTTIKGTLNVDQAVTLDSTLNVTGVITGNGSGLTALNGDNIASGTVADARIASTLARDSEVWGAPTASEATNNLENVVTIQAKTLAGGDLEERRLVRVWIAETDYGTASTNNIASLVLSTGVAVDTVTENADYRYVTAADGSALATITAEATATHYLMVSDGSSISSTEITFTSP